MSQRVSCSDMCPSPVLSEMLRLPPQSLDILVTLGMEHLEPSILEWASGRKAKVTSSGVGYYDAFRLYVRHSILYPSAQDSVSQDTWGTIAEIFGYRAWNKDEHKLVNEKACARGERAGGQFMYVLRRVRELLGKDIRFAGMETFKCLPVHGTPPLHGNLINEFDTFLLYKKGGS